MLHKLINRNTDLKKLADEGYGLAMTDGYLLVRDIPYVNPEQKVLRGTLVFKLELADDKTVPPSNHEADFIGDLPSNADGSPIVFINDSSSHNLSANLTSNHHFSAKPPEGQYADYHAKVSRYALILYSQAQVIEPGVNPFTHLPIPADDEESVFKYLDTNSTRADIVQVSQKLENLKIGIVGMGGTGSYILDLVAKTWVKEIHIFDGDTFLNHNAYRMPGAADAETVGGNAKKVHYHESVYSKLRNGITSHDANIDETNVQDLLSLDFVFVCIDKAEAKKIIFEKLLEKQIPFIDVGIGVQNIEGSLLASLRTTIITPQKQDHVSDYISMADNDNEEYIQNIQIADLNALNAALAVIKWKKYFGFYHDLEKEFNSIYNTDTNQIFNNDDNS